MKKIMLLTLGIILTATLAGCGNTISEMQADISMESPGAVEIRCLSEDDHAADVKAVVSANTWLATAYRLL